MHESKLEVSEIVSQFLPGGIMDLFRLMDIAEEEIARCKKRHPKHADAIHDAFRYCCPQHGMKNPRLYRLHVQELIERIIDGKSGRDLDLATDAELLFAFSEASQVSMLVSAANALYWKLFCKHFPESKIAQDSTGFALQERWPGETDELYASLRKQFTVKRDVRAK